MLINATVSAAVTGDVPITITQRTSSETVAPMGVWFDTFIDVADSPVPGPASADIVYDPRMHEIEYVWDFDDAANATPEHTINTVASWRNLNKAYGYQVAHVFNDPGTYTVTCTAYYNGAQIGQQTSSVTVQDPDVVYSGTRTIVCSQVSDWTGAPDGATQVTSLSAAAAANDALGTTTGRLLLNRGETFSRTALTLNNNNFRVGAYGTGARPILTCADRTVGAPEEILQMTDWDMTDWCIYDLELQSGFDPTTLSGDPRCRPWRHLFHGGTDATYVHHRLKLSGFDLATHANLGSDGKFHCFNDVEIAGWNDYGLYGHSMPESWHDQRLAVVGCSIYQSGDAIYNGGKDGFGNDHGGIRNSNTKKVYFGVNSLFSNAGWSGFRADLDAITAHQPCIRINSRGNKDRQWNMDRVAVEGGFEMVRNKGFSDSISENPGNYLVDRMLMVAGCQTIDFFITEYGGTTKRNVVAIRPDAKVAGPGSFSFFRSGAVDSQPGNYDSKLAVYNCTAINLQTLSNDTGDMVFSTGLGNFTDVEYENNIFYAPDQTTPDTSDAPIDTATTIDGYTCRTTGQRTGAGRLFYTPPSNINNGDSFTKSYPAGFVQADFSTGNGHAITIDDDYYWESQGDVTFAFNVSDITITNTSGAVWPSGVGDVVVNVIPDTYVTDTSYANPATIILPRPLTGSAALDDATTGRVSRLDFFEVVRPATKNRGALEDV